jgi:hypothetical protein
MPTKRLWEDDAVENELERLGLLPTSECPVGYRALSSGGYALFLHLGAALDRQTLLALGACKDPAEVIQKGVAALASDPPSIAADQ